MNHFRKLYMPHKFFYAHLPSHTDLIPIPSSIRSRLLLLAPCHLLHCAQGCLFYLLGCPRHKIYISTLVPLVALTPGISLLFSSTFLNPDFTLSHPLLKKFLVFVLSDSFVSEGLIVFPSWFCNFPATLNMGVKRSSVWIGLFSTSG